MKVSTGCRFCYAEAERTRKTRWANTWGPPETSERIKTSEANWRKPLQWNRQAAAEGRRYRVFCASLADVFEDNPSLEDWRADLLTVIEATPRLDWLLLTKRPENVARMTRRWQHWRAVWPRNVRIGTSCENQAVADKRLFHLLNLGVPNFVSIEPLLQQVQLMPSPGYWLRMVGKGIDWVIIGGESGHHAREMKPHWAVDLVNQCRRAGVPVFVKQLGTNFAKRAVVPVSNGKLTTVYRLGDHKGGDMDYWPEELRIREFPR